MGLGEGGQVRGYWSHGLCLLPICSATHVIAVAFEVVFLVAFCPHKAVSVNTGRELNVTLLLKICHHLSALGPVSKSLTIVHKDSPLQDLSSSCFSHSG